MKRSRIILSALLSALALCGLRASAGDPAHKPGIEEKLGAFVPLDVAFADEEGAETTLRKLVVRPTVLLIVYLRCPNICNPTMHEMAKTLDKLDLRPGSDFDLVTISMDETDTPELAKVAKKNLLDSLQKKIPPEGWRFLTGKPENIRKVTDAAGFYFERDKADFIHASTLIFISKEGKIVRYLPGLKILPADMKMAILDAAEGVPRPFIEKIQRLCFTYDPKGQTYVLRVNRIILAVTFLFVGSFAAFLLIRRRGAKAKKASVL